MRLFAVGVLGALVVAAGAAAEPPASSGSRIVPCSEVIGQTRFPYVGNRLPQYRYRTFLSATSVPPGYMRAYENYENRENRSSAWPWWTKYGVVVRASGPRVTFSVPLAWRNRVGIRWGNAGPVLASVTLTSCAGPTSIGHAYAGGFFIRRSGECFPLDLRAGAQKMRVWFGLGNRCPATTG